MQERNTGHKVGPPRWADRFLEWYCRPELLESIQGDAHELFAYRLQRFGQRSARVSFIWDVIRFFRLSNIRKPNPSFNTMLFRNDLKIAFRQMGKQKFYSIIKIGGFSIGIAACLLIALFIRDELSYDRQTPGADQIFRVVATDGEFSGVHCPAPFAEAMLNDYPEVEMAARLVEGELFGAGAKEFRRVDQLTNYHEEGFVYADQTLLDIFQWPMAYGDRSTALSEPNRLVISKSTADKYFPNENPVGKVVILDNNVDNPYTIGGVIEDIPNNFHFRYKNFMTLSGVEFWAGEQKYWRTNNYHTYIRVKQGTAVEKLEENMLSTIDRYLIPSLVDEGIAPETKGLEKLRFVLQPVTDIHLHSQGIYDNQAHGDIRTVWLFGIIALFILLIAAINFINLSTARSTNRAKEVGVRKVVGSRNYALVKQFLVESMLYCLFALAIGIMIVVLLLPAFNEMAGKNLVVPWDEWWLFPCTGVLILIVGLLSGIYPAFYLSAFHPIEVLKGNLVMGTGKSNLRNILVTFQFTTSIVLIASTFIVYQQMNFIFNKDLGFNKEQVMLLNGTHTLGERASTFKKELLNLPGIEHVTIGDYLPVVGTKRNGNTFWLEGKMGQDVGVPGQFWRVDHDYLTTMGMNLVEGRNFSSEMAADSQAFIVNEAMLTQLGIENPIGTRITNGGEVWPIIGVVEDFHYESMRREIKPLCLVVGNSPTMISLRCSPNNINATIDQVKILWDRFSPHQSIRYTFLDENFAAMYEDVHKTGQVFSSFALLAIFVACLGLFGLSAYSADQRRKEISIRKILGASIGNILGLLTQNHLKLILLALIISIPVVWYFMNQWLADFEYRTSISWLVFATAGLMALVIAFLTIGYQALQLAVGNPADSFKST